MDTLLCCIWVEHFGTHIFGACKCLEKAVCFSGCLCRFASLRYIILGQPVPGSRLLLCMLCAVVLCCFTGLAHTHSTYIHTHTLAHRFTVIALCLVCCIFYVLGCACACVLTPWDRLTNWSGQSMGPAIQRATEPYRCIRERRRERERERTSSGIIHWMC